jgi:hypothetical protein
VYFSLFEPVWTHAGLQNTFVNGLACHILILYIHSLACCTNCNKINLFSILKKFKKHALSELGMITKPTNAHKCIKVFYIINTVLLQHVLVVLVAILREVYCEEWMWKDITEICELMHKCKILSFNIKSNGGIDSM